MLAIESLLFTPEEVIEIDFESLGFTSMEDIDLSVLDSQIYGDLNESDVEGGIVQSSLEALDMMYAIEKKYNPELSIADYYSAEGVGSAIVKTITVVKNTIQKLIAVITQILLRINIMFRSLMEKGTIKYITAHKNDQFDNLDKAVPVPKQFNHLLSDGFITDETSLFEKVKKTIGDQIKAVNSESGEEIVAEMESSAKEMEVAINKVFDQLENKSFTVGSILNQRVFAICENTPKAFKENQTALKEELELMKQANSDKGIENGARLTMWVKSRRISSDMVNKFLRMSITRSSFVGFVAHVMKSNTKKSSDTPASE